MRYIKKSEIEPRDLREYKKNCRKASPPLKITYKGIFYIICSFLGVFLGYLCGIFSEVILFNGISEFN